MTMTGKLAVDDIARGPMSLDEWDQRPSAARGQLRAGDVQHGGRQVDRFHQSLFHPAVHSTWRPHDVRHTHRAAVEDIFVYHFVIAQHLAVIGSVDDPRVLPPAAIVYRFDDVADLLIDE